MIFRLYVFDDCIAERHGEDCAGRPRAFHIIQCSCWCHLGKHDLREYAIKLDRDYKRLDAICDKQMDKIHQLQFQLGIAQLGKLSVEQPPPGIEIEL